MKEKPIKSNTKRFTSGGEDEGRIPMIDGHGSPVVTDKAV